MIFKTIMYSLGVSIATGFITVPRLFQWPMLYIKIYVYIIDRIHMPRYIHRCVHT